MKTPSSSNLFFYLVMLCNFFVFFLVIFFVSLFYRNPFPFSDEWDFIIQAVSVEPLTWNWVWAQHSDHRIPLQKIIQVSLLRLGEYNFNLLIFANVTLIFLTSSMLIFAVRIYRGSSQVGDLIFPLILMNPGFGPFLWSFHFQFMSSTLLSLLFLSFFLQNNKSFRNIRYIIGSIFILLMALCGMNGVVSSIIVSLLLLPYIIWARPINNNCVLYTVVIILALTLMVSFFIIGSWNPSGATSTLSSTVIFNKANSIITNYFYLVNPSPVIMPGKQVYFFLIYYYIVLRLEF